MGHWGLFGLKVIKAKLSTVLLFAWFLFIL